MQFLIAVRMVPFLSIGLSSNFRAFDVNVISCINVMSCLRSLAGYPIRPRRRYRYRGLRVVIAPPQARLHVSRAPPEGLDWSSTREGFLRRAIGRPPQAFEPAPNTQGTKKLLREVAKKLLREVTNLIDHSAGSYQSN